MEEIFLFNDTETTGFSKPGALIQEGQGRVCQIALLLTDSTGKSLAEFSALVKPDGWKIHEGAQKIHGFSDAQCERFGIAQKAMVSLYVRLCSMATLRVAHNDEFDNRMMEIEQEYAMQHCNKITTPSFCTMKNSVNEINLPPTEKMRNAGFNKPKVPKLEEALQFYCGRSLGDTAHNAMWDVQACRDIFFAMRAKRAAA